jgi:hypothetical protein
MIPMSVWHLFFSWPAGGTWSNMIASLEWVAVAGAAVWLFRDRIGRRLAAWWHKHHGPHLARTHLEVLRAHDEERMAMVRKALDGKTLQDPEERM